MNNMKEIYCTVKVTLFASKPTTAIATCADKNSMVMGIGDWLRDPPPSFHRLSLTAWTVSRISNKAPPRTLTYPSGYETIGYGCAVLIYLYFLFFLYYYYYYFLFSLFLCSLRGSDSNFLTLYCNSNKE